MTKVAGLDQLSVINQKVVGEGEVLPQVVLKDGIAIFNSSSICPLSPAL